MKRKPWSRILDYVILVAIVLMLYIIHIIYDSRTMHSAVNYFEEGNVVACVNEVLNGKVPYRDVFHQFGPLNTYLQIFCMSIFGLNIAAMRVFFYVGTVLTILIAYLLARRLCKNSGFAYAAALVLIVETYTLYFATRWGGLRFGAGLLAILCAIQYLKNENNLWAACAGICAAIAFMISFDIGVMCSAAIAITFCLHTLYDYLVHRRLRFAGLIFFAAGACVAFAPLGFYFIFAKAMMPYLGTISVLAMNHMKVWGQRYSVDFWALLHPSRFFTMDFKYALPVVFYIFSGAYLMRGMIRKSISWKEFGMLCLTVYGALMYMASFRCITGPQFQMALQPLIVLGAVFSEKIFSRMMIHGKRACGRNRIFSFIAYFAVFAIIVSYALFSEKVIYGGLNNRALHQKYKEYAMLFRKKTMPDQQLGSSVLTIDRAKGIKVPSSQAVEMEGVVNYIISVTKPGESVFSFPDLGLFNFLADRPCVGRFNIPVFAWISPVWREELLAELKKASPRYVIYGRKLSSVAYSIGMKTELLPEVIDYITSHYKREASFGSIDILRRIGT